MFVIEENKVKREINILRVFLQRQNVLFMFFEVFFLRIQQRVFFCRLRFLYKSVKLMSFNDKLMFMNKKYIFNSIE